MKITFDKPSPDGSRALFIDGERWGVIIKSHRGPNGYFLRVDDIHHITVRKDKTGPYRGDPPIWQIESDKIAKRRAPPNTVVPPFEQRLVAEIRSMIESGKLRSPHTLRREADEREAKRKRD